MWTRKDLKNEAKTYFKMYYWPSVFTSIFLMLFGTLSFVSTGTSGLTRGRNIIELISDPEFPEMLKAAMGGAIIFAVAAVLLSVFVVNVISVGGAYFHLHCRKANDEGVSCIDTFRGFRGDHYGNIIKVMFLKKLFVFLWSLLLIIPGIIKSFQYAMVEYILSENPNMDYKEAFRRSRDMMQGNKWKYFVLMLSFILWDILNVFTFGLLGIFWIHPYKQHTYAAFYKAVSVNKVQ